MPESERELKVVIVGAGTSGLMLAVMLELGGIDYVLLEKKPAFRPASRGCVIGPLILPLMEQIGILREIKDISLPTRKIKIQRCDNPGESVGEIDASFVEERYGYPLMIVPRPALYNVLLSKIPKHKILLGKRVLSTSQSDLGVLVRCADGSTFSGDVLVGADGSNSSVRQNLYRQPEVPNTSTPPVPAPADERNGSDTTWTVMGITNPLDKDLYPDMGQPYSDFVAMMGQKSREVLWFMPTANRRLLWAIITPVEKSDKALCDDGFMATDPGPEAIEEMCSKYQHFGCPIGGTMKDMFDQSPPHLMSKNLTNNRVYDKWCGGRTVLVGNAVHKFLPSAGLNDSLNMVESVALANRLHELESNGFHEIRATFEQYQENMEPLARRVLQLSRRLDSTFTEQASFSWGMQQQCKKSNPYRARFLVLTLSFWIIF
ncbi:MAG: hypothetical protein J3Q66DRAFT_343166 [Benniella sp.]|nr:MAG: hypothetical protein J3Q66DRAFT_343166 [Benniella sp.]